MSFNQCFILPCDWEVLSPNNSVCEESYRKVKKNAKQLGVSNILEGSVRFAGNRVRITAQLIQAVDDFHFWSETWDRQMESIFEIQDEISRMKPSGGSRKQ